jgi:hypothetical protein
LAKGPLVIRARRRSLAGNVAQLALDLVLITLGGGMAEIISREGVVLNDPPLVRVLDRVVKIAELAAQKAAAHVSKPAQYPIAGGESLEQVFVSRLKEFKPEKRAYAVSKTVRLVEAPLDQRKLRYGDLATLNIAAATDIATQAIGVELPVSFRFPVTDLPPIVRGAGLVVQQALDTLELRVHKVRCVDETGSGIGEWGKDEIALGGSIIDATGTTTKIPQFNVASFDDGDVKTYSPPKRFGKFDLTKGEEWPKSYFATVVLAEKDMGGLADYVDKLVKLLRQHLAKVLGAAVGVAVAAYTSPEIGALVGLAVVYVVNKLLDWLRVWYSDDIFKPVTLRTTLTSMADRWAGATDSPNYKTTFSGHNGKYELTYDWRLVTA